MNLIVIAIGAGILVWLGLFMMERRKNNRQHNLSSELQTTDDHLSLMTQFNKDRHLIHYADYILSPREYMLTVTGAIAAFFLIGYIFYHHLIIAGIMALAGFYYPKIRRDELRDKRKAELSVQFRHALFSLSSSLGAGKSVENAFLDTVHDLKLLYPDPNTYIILEFEIMNRIIENGESIERALMDFSKRADIEDITNFSDVFITCKKTGGNLIQVIRRTANMIGEKLDIQQEIAVVVSQKKFESKILSFAPLVMIALLTYSSGDYMTPLYSGKGMIVMTFALFLFIFCYWLTKKIMDIKV